MAKFYLVSPKSTIINIMKEINWDTRFICEDQISSCLGRKVMKYYLFLLRFLYFLEFCSYVAFNFWRTHFQYLSLAFAPPPPPPFPKINEIMWF